MTQRPHLEQSARDALDDLGLACDDNTEDLRRSSGAAPAPLGNRSEDDPSTTLEEERLTPIMSHSAECTRCSRLTGAGRAARQLDRVSNLVELARADVEATVRNLDDDAPLLTVADLYAAAAHLRRAGELIDQAAELLEAAQ